MIRSRTWGILFGAMVAGCLVVLLLTNKGTGTLAYIYQNGKMIHSVDLSQVTEAYELPVKDETGTNLIRVEHGRICMRSADCPDQTCVHMGWSEGESIVCLPHRLVIQFESNDLDTAAG